MGRRLKLQRRGKGSPKYKATHKAKVNIKYPVTNKVINAQVIELFTDPIRSAPVAKIILEDNTYNYVICAEGLMTGQKIEIGSSSEHKVGNILPLSEIESGSEIFNIEKNYGDGGKFARAGGQYGVLVSKKDYAYVKMPSGKVVKLPLDARATIGFVASSGREAKPFVKAGNKFQAMKAKGKAYPRVRGVAMNPVDHPFGGFQHHVGHSKSTSRHAAAGRKVGSIASKRTGRKKK